MKTAWCFGSCYLFDKDRKGWKWEKVKLSKRKVTKFQYITLKIKEFSLVFTSWTELHYFFWLTCCLLNRTHFISSHLFVLRYTLSTLSHTPFFSFWLLNSNFSHQITPLSSFRGGVARIFFEDVFHNVIQLVNSTFFH